MRSIASFGAMVRIALVAIALTASVAYASSSAALAWPESKQTIPAGSGVQLGEFFDLEPEMFVPCQAFVPATVLTNAQSLDTVSASASSGWDECGAVTVTGGFTAVQLDQQTIQATAEPEISLTNASGCVYRLGKVEGHEAIAGFASYSIKGSATLMSGSSCAAELPIEGSLGLFGPQAGGEGLLPWISAEAPAPPIAPQNTVAPSIQGAQDFNGTLTCSPGTWTGTAPLSFSYQWLHGSVAIPGATASTYAPPLSLFANDPPFVSEASSFVCEVSVSNVAGRRTARSAWAFPNGPDRPVTFHAPSSTQIAAAMKASLTPRGKAAKITKLLLAGRFSLLVRALLPGTAVIRWYQVHPTAHRAGASTKPLLVASGNTSFKSATGATMRIKLTRRGRSILAHRRRVALVARGSFTPTGSPPIMATAHFTLKR